MKIEETITKYGYDPSKLGNFSLRLIIFKCEFCNDDYENRLPNMNRSKFHSCKECLLIAKEYFDSKSTENKYEFREKYVRSPKKGWDIAKCEFCLNDYEYRLKDPKFIDNPSCKKCSSIAYSHKIKYSSKDKHEFWKIRFEKPRTKTKITVKCEFCLEDFETTCGILYNDSELICCKKCDAIASVYSRFKSIENKHEFYLKRRPTLVLDCLDINKTVLKFGYNPTTLSTYSKSKIVAKCKYCDVRVEIPMSKYSSRKGRISCKKCIGKKTKETIIEKYGVECTLDIPSVQAKLVNPKTEQIVESILQNRYSIEFVRNYSIGPYSFDFYIPSCNLLVEIQGDFFHGFKKYGYEALPKDRAKSSYIENNTNLKLVWIWEHELHLGRLNKILDFHIYKITEPEINVELEKLTFKQISNHDAHVFLSSYHYLGNLGTVASSFGAYYNDLLIAVCVFGGITRNQSIKKVNTFTKKNYGPKEIRELRRFCIRPNIIVKNCASYSLTRFVDLLKEHTKSAEILISFSDPTVGDLGTIYKATNWQKMGDSVKSYHYLDSGKMIHKRTVWDMAKQNHMKEEDFAIQLGLTRVEELPKNVWLKSL